MDAALSSTVGGQPGFAPTQWGLVAAASAEGTVHAAPARAALESLYRVYCYPVYAFIRRRGHGRQDAQDLTQDFFVHLLEKHTLGRADPHKGRFRSFLLGALEHFLAHAAERAGARKRGGGAEFIFLDDEQAESRYQLAAPAGQTAEAIFEARWAEAVVAAALGRLHAEMEAAGKAARFTALRGFLSGGENATYQQTAAALGLPVAALKSHVHRLRGRYRALLRQEILRTVTAPAEVDGELRHLVAVLTRGGMP